MFQGCTYTDPNLGYKLYRQSWPASTVAADAFAYVITDPNVLFQAQANGSLAQATLGGNLAVVQNAGNTTTGNSAVALAASTVAASTFLPFRLVGFVDSTTSRVGDAFTDAIVRFNFGIHSYESATGLA